MSGEARLLSLLRQIATDPAARGLLDDAAVLEFGGTRLVLTHDMLVEGVHFLRTDPAQDVAWKLLAVNLSDLAAKGAKPLGVMLGYSMRNDAEWDGRFVEGLAAALDALGLALLGGDTVSIESDVPRFFGLTAIGSAEGAVPSRSGASPGDLLWVSGTIGDARPGLRIAKNEREGPDELLIRYRRPLPRLEAGQRLAPLVSAMMDVSDGLLIDARRLGEASGVEIQVALDQIPLSQPYLQFAGDDRGSRLSAATAGDDYELLFTTLPEHEQEIAALGENLRLPLTKVGRVGKGSGLKLSDKDVAVPLPQRLGFEHGA